MFRVKNMILAECIEDDYLRHIFHLYHDSTKRFISLSPTFLFLCEALNGITFSTLPVYHLKHYSIISVCHHRLPIIAQYRP